MIEKNLTKILHFQLIVSLVIGKTGHPATDHAMEVVSTEQGKLKPLQEMEASFAKEMQKKFKSVIPNHVQVRFLILGCDGVILLVSFFRKSYFYQFIILVACEWNDWHEWEQCSKSCGGGITSRTRNIKQYAQLGGQDCVGDAFQTKECNKQDCPSMLLS